MRYAITYLTNKIVDAENKELSLDEKLRIICPACQHPLTYVEPIRNARHFRHPRRTGPELIDPNLECEARVSKITEQAVRTYNRIIDQTNIQLFQRHFYRIVVTALIHEDADPATIKNWINATKELISCKESISLLRDIDQYCDEYKQNVLTEDPELTEAIRKRNKQLPFKARCTFIRNNAAKIDHENDYCKFRQEIEILNSLEPANRVLCHMVKWYDEEGYENYPESILEDYWNIMSNIFKMLDHEKSEEMRHFAYAFSTQLIIAKMASEGESANWEDRSSINYLISRYMMTALQPSSDRERPLHQIAKDIDSLLHQGTGLVDYLTSIGDMFSIPSPDRWLEVIKKVDASEAWKDYNGKSGFIYIAFNKIDDVSAVNQVKIGKAKDIEKRRANYQTYSPDGFAFYNVYSVCDRHGAERYIQKKLKSHQIKGDGGQEWYKLSPDEADKKVSKYIHEYTQKWVSSAKKLQHHNVEGSANQQNSLAHY